MEILRQEIQQFIYSHENDDERLIVLKYDHIKGVAAALVAAQIAGRRKAKEKLPLYFNAKNIIYPPSVNLEQSSSQQTALFKAELLNEEKGIEKNKVVDLTGGFGVDTYFLSRAFSSAIYVDPNFSLLEIAKHNHAQLGTLNISYYNSSAEEFLLGNYLFDLIFIDPSRRDGNKQKVFKLSDCEPNVVKLQSELFQKSKCILIKTSPLLDIQQGLKELNNVEKVFIVSVNNETKEVLYLCRKNFEQEPSINAVNIKDKQIEKFVFNHSDEKNIRLNFSYPLKYLYEPNSSILKAGAFKSVAEIFNLYKIHPNTHLYTSNALIDFPGRVFELIKQIKSDPKEIEPLLPEQKANVVTRNYPLTSDSLKKKLKLKDGGDKYVIAFTTHRQKEIYLAERIR